MPGRDDLEDGETLQYDPTAYMCMSTMSLEWPSLSFDIIKDSLGDNRSAFPHTLFFVGGTQAANAKLNYIAVVKVSNITQGKHGKQAENAESESDDDDDDDMVSSDEEDEAETARMAVRKVAHTGGINRIRSMPQQPHIVASWADTAQVQVLDLGALLNDVAGEEEDKKGAAGKVQKVNARQVHAHSSEGFALDWSPVAVGKLASGDCRSKLHIWEPTPAGRWAVSAAYKGHEASVEDIQWSPTEETVLATCSVDKTIKVWDTREPSRPMLSVEAHSSDVNVISWNKATTYMLASGGDDGALRIWDLRQFSPGCAPVANFAYHKAPITAVEWCPHEASSLATSSSDHQVAVWDLALERDPEEEAALAPETNAEAPQDLPPQLLFVHAGQRDPKEIHWHPQIPGMMMSSGEDGYNIFQPSNLVNQ